MSQLTKISPNNSQLETITPKNYLAVFTQIKLTPYRKLSLPDCLIMEFWRGNPTKKGPKELALLTFNRDKTAFKLSYYPLNGEIQVIRELNISELRQAANDLIEAGFK